MKYILFLTLSLFLAGCHQASSEPAPPNKAKNELASKLKTMTPEQQKVYLQQHPDEVRKALPGFGGK